MHTYWRLRTCGRWDRSDFMHGGKPSNQASRRERTSFAVFSICSSGNGPPFEKRAREASSTIKFTEQCALNTHGVCASIPSVCDGYGIHLSSLSS